MATAAAAAVGSELTAELSMGNGRTPDKRPSSPGFRGRITRKKNMWGASEDLNRSKMSLADTVQAKQTQAQQIKRKPRLQIDPRTSKYMSYWDSCTALALIFTALVTPFEVSFLEPATSALEPLFIVNRVVDAVFIIDMVLTFMLVYQEAGGAEGTRWVEDPWRIAKHYLCGSFAVDLISVTVSYTHLTLPTILLV